MMSIIEPMNPWNGPYVIRLWDDKLGLVSSVTRTNDMDLSIVARAHGEPIGTAFGTSLDCWIETPEVAVMIYPLFPHERKEDMKLVRYAMDYAANFTRAADRLAKSQARLHLQAEKAGGRDPRNRYF